MSNTIKRYRDQYWYNANGQLHREDGPAYIGINGSQSWLLNGKYHRSNGPALIWVNVCREWWINHTRIRSNKEFQEAASLSDEEMTAIILKYGNVE